MILRASRLQQHFALVLCIVTIQRLIRFVKCQTQTAPQCILACIPDQFTNANDCSPTENGCLCARIASSAFLDSDINCIQSTCEGSDLTNANLFLQQTCKSVGITLTISATASAVPLDEDDSGPSISTQTTSSISTSIPGPSSGSPTADAVPTENKSGIPSGNSGARRSPVPVLAGVLSSVGVLISGAATAFCLLRRRRTRNMQTVDQYTVVPHTKVHILPVAGTGSRLGGRHLGGNLDPFKSEDDGNVRRESIPPFVKPNIGTRNEGSGEEAVAWMRQVSEIREEMARLRQLLISSHQSPSDSPTSNPDQTAQLSEMREEMQRLQHLVSLPPADRRNDFDGVSRTTSLPAYED